MVALFDTALDLFDNAIFAVKYGREHSTRTTCEHGIHRGWTFVQPSQANFCSALPLLSVILSIIHRYNVHAVRSKAVAVTRNGINIL